MRVSSACYLITFLCAAGMAGGPAAAAQAKQLPLTQDWQTAVRVVQRVYPGSQQWLLDCSASEGGHGVWVFRGHRVLTAGLALDPPDVPGGPLQYFRSTFETDFRAALRDLYARGIRVPVQAASWFSPLGQAIAGGWAWGHNRPSGKWTGGGC